MIRGESGKKKKKLNRRTPTGSNFLVRENKSVGQKRILKRCKVYMAAASVPSV